MLSIHGVLSSFPSLPNSQIFILAGKLLTYVPHFLFYQLMVGGLPGNLGLNARDLVTVEFKHVLARALTRAPPMEGKIASV